MPAPAGTIRTDQVKPRQSLCNLLSNAAKFTKDGRVTLDVERYDQEGVEWLSFRVSDSGIGMTPQELDRLFQPFTQADASTTKKFGGTGLGLTISRQLCRLLGGDIEVKSEDGVGTIFTVRTPASVSVETGAIKETA